MMKAKAARHKLLHLVRGQWYLITWLDAATIKHVPPGTEPKDVDLATVQRVPGRFLGIERDRVYGVPHLILWEKQVAEAEYWTCIPVCLFLDAQPLPEKVALQAVKQFIAERT